MKKLLLVIFSLISFNAYAALSSTIVWDCRATASANNVNGGGFKTGASGTNYSKQDAAQWQLTGIATAGVGAVFLTASADATMVGNIAHVVSGTNFTAGWYEIVSVSAGVSVTVDRNVCTGIGANGVINIGGALSLNSTLDDDFFEAVTAGNIIGIMSGSYSLGETINIAKTGTTTAYITLEGYKTTLGDNPTLTDRPTIAEGANQFIITGTNYEVLNLQFTSSGTRPLSVSTSSHVRNVKVTGTGSIGLTLGQYAIASLCEVIAPNAIETNNAGARIISCYAHDGVTGLYSNGDSYTLIINSIFDNFSGTGLQFNNGAGSMVIGNTIYGIETTAGTGISIAAIIPGIGISNNIIYGWATGISHGTANYKDIWIDYNNFYNNDADVSNVVKQDNNIAVDPQFVNAASGDFTVKTGSGIIGVGCQVNTNLGLTGNYSVNTGADQNDHKIFSNAYTN